MASGPKGGAAGKYYPSGQPKRLPTSRAQDFVRLTSLEGRLRVCLPGKRVKLISVPILISLDSDADNLTDYECHC